MNLPRSFLPILKLCFSMLMLLALSNNSKAETVVEFDWHVFDTALMQQVESTEKFGVELTAVPYQTLRDMKSFSSIADDLASYDPSDLNHKQKLAFYINAYNYFAIKILIDNKPVESIKDLGSSLHVGQRSTVKEEQPVTGTLAAWS